MLGPSPTRAAVALVVDVFLHAAETHLRSRTVSCGPTARFGLPLRDLALDCVANLLARDQQGSFPHLEQYFADGWMDLDEVGVMRRIRCLVCRAVDDGLYRRYGEHDPQLARLIRGLQRACSARSDVKIERSMGTLHLVVKGPGRRQGLPVSRDRLEAYLMAHIRATDTAVSYVAHFVDLVRKEQDVALSYPLVGVALAVRAALARLNGPSTSAPPECRPDMEETEAEEFIRVTVREIANEHQPNYVGKGKVDATVYAAYGAAVRDLLLAHFREDIGSTTLGDCLQVHLPGLSREAYRDQHRARCEYLLRLARERLQHVLRNSRTFSAGPVSGDD